MLLQGYPHNAKKVLKSAMETSHRTPYWHCRLLLQKAVCITTVIMTHSPSLPSPSFSLLPYSFDRMSMFVKEM